MKGEMEIQEKLDFYEAILAEMESGRMVDNPDLFLRLSRRFSREAMEMLNNLTGAEALVSILPPEDQPWVRQWFGSLTLFPRQVLETRISLLRWVLERETGSRGVTGGQGI